MGAQRPSWAHCGRYCQHTGHTLHGPAFETLSQIVTLQFRSRVADLGRTEGRGGGQESASRIPTLRPMSNPEGVQTPHDVKSRRGAGVIEMSRLLPNGDRKHDGARTELQDASEAAHDQDTRESGVLTPQRHDWWLYLCRPQARPTPEPYLCRHPPTPCLQLAVPLTSEGRLATAGLRRGSSSASLSRG
jgi:hypothetical protein